MLKTIASRIPLFGSRKNHTSTAELIFEILLRLEPLTITQLTKILRDEHHCRLSYQAVRKAVRKLLRQDVLERNDGWRINKKWLFALRNSLDKAIERYYAPELKTKYQRGQSNQTFLCSSLFELDSFWGELWLEICSQVKKPEKKLLLSLNHYAFSMPFNMGRETGLIDKVIKLGFEICFVFSKNGLLNAWATKLYRNSGVSVIFNPKLKLEPSQYLNVIGSKVIQVEMPIAATKLIEKMFAGNRRVEDLSSKELTELAHAKFKTPIRINVFDNASWAELLRLNIN